MTTITYHIEPADCSVTVWAECDQLPGFSALAASIDDVRAAVLTALADEGLESSSVREELAEDGLWVFGDAGSFAMVVPCSPAPAASAAAPVVEWELASAE